MNYIRKWTDSLSSLASRSVPKRFLVNGTRDAHLGPRLEYANVAFEIIPSETFEVDASAVDKKEAPGYSTFLEASIFGLLDVLMVADPLPVTKLRVIVNDLDVDPVSSSVMAFRKAGRDAGRKLLELMRSYPSS